MNAVGAFVFVFGVTLLIAFVFWLDSLGIEWYWIIPIAVLGGLIVGIVTNTYL